MAARLTMLLPRLAVLVVIWLLAAASFTFAADSNQPAAHESAADGAGAKEPKVLIVPDVRRQAYVFAKGILQDAGFAWRVDGAVKGFAPNLVSVQNPAPGVRVIDNGSPTVVLRLARNPGYAENGLPDNRAPFPGTSVVLLRDWKAANAAPKQAEPAAPAEAPAAPEKKEKKTAPKAPAATETKRYRKPDFVVPNAAREPADEIPLPARARMLQRRASATATPSRKFARFWLYQHTWIVTGAEFGWKNGDEALRILISVDRDLQDRFGFGAKSEAVARRALADVRRQKG